MVPGEPPPHGRARLTKKLFISLPDGYCLLSNTYPMQHVQLGSNREEQWKAFRKECAGRLVHVFDSKQECAHAMVELSALRDASHTLRGRLVGVGKIFHAYLEADESLPRDPVEARAFQPGTYCMKLTKRALMGLPTASRLVSNAHDGESRTPILDELVPPLPEREGFWLQIKNQGLNGRTFGIYVATGHRDDG